MAAMTMGGERELNFVELNTAVARVRALPRDAGKLIGVIELHDLADARTVLRQAHSHHAPPFARHSPPS